MIQGHAGRRVATGASRRSWTLTLLLLAVAFATVVMHHLVGAHQHDSNDLVTPHGASAAAPVSHSGHVERSDVTATHPPNATGASLHVHHEPSDGGAHSWLHPCLAVLAAAAAAVVALHLIRESAAPANLGGGRRQRTHRADGAPPPPVPLRLAQLQVLRL